MIKDSNVVDSTKLDDNKVIIIRNSFSNPLDLTLSCIMLKNDQTYF